MKKIISLILVAVLALSMVLALGSCAEKQKSVYEITNSSSATSITANVRYVATNGDEFYGWYVIKRAGNDMIVDYEFNRYTTVEESVAAGTAERFTEEKGKIYYYGGKYYNSGDISKTPWVDSPLDIDFKFQVEREKFATAMTTADKLTVYATATPENFSEMFGFNCNADGSVSIMLTTNGVQLTETEITYTNKSGGTTAITTTYSYSENVLDFTEITGEAEEEVEAE